MWGSPPPGVKGVNRGGWTRWISHSVGVGLAPRGALLGEGPFYPGGVARGLTRFAPGGVPTRVGTLWVGWAPPGGDPWGASWLWRLGYLLGGHL